MRIYRLLVLLGLGSTRAFQSPYPVAQPRALYSAKDEFDSILPETSFGSETVPEDQRPINEYLNILRQPLFGWATEGDQGLLLRLSILYGVVFGAVCFPIAGASECFEGRKESIE